MNSTAMHRWASGCIPGFVYGCGPSDVYHLGMRSYIEPYPCPNGLPLRREPMRDVPESAQRLQKAAADIAAWNRRLSVAALATSITDRQRRLFLEVLSERV